VLEKDCTARILFDEIQGILADETRCAKMQKALQNMVVLDSAERLCDIIAELASGKTKEK